MSQSNAPSWSEKVMRLRQSEIRSQLFNIEGWRLYGRQISRTFVFQDFVRGIRFVNRIAKLAEAMNHHPDIRIRYNKIRLVLSTHDEGGLTMKDFKLARGINQLRIPSSLPLA